MQTKILEQDVLFQKIGSTWFLFTEIDNDVVYSSLPVGIDPRKREVELSFILEEHQEKVANHRQGLPKEAA